MPVMQSKLGASYSVATKILRVTAWLEQDGSLVTTPTSANLKVYARGAPTVTVVDVTSVTPAAPGQIVFGEVTALTLDPLVDYFAIISVTSGGTPYPSGDVLVPLG